jgi:hypothetical protein
LGFESSRLANINFDSLTELMLTMPNDPGFFLGTFGQLGANGQASAQVV